VSQQTLPSAELADGQAREITDGPDGAPGAVSAFVLRYQGQVFAYRNVCPHQRVPLNWQPDGFWTLDRTALQCALHGAQFQPDTGECISGPCVGRALEPLAVSERDGMIYLTP
jgi:nitrite reductase/ring-hydroxylating ferredoxin subunit